MEPASSIIKALGGVNAVAEITGAHRTRVYKWMKSKREGGTDGFIPTPQALKILNHSQSRSLPLEAKDFLPAAKVKGVGVK